jgi:drug/metabolite transporter (DMT)-like permease
MAPPSPAAFPPPSRASVATAFAALYILWGSTYLAMRVAVQTLPPFLLASVRFFTAGLILTLWARRSLPTLTRAHVREAAISGVLLLMIGNGGVVWSVQYIPSGLAALMVATVPLWMVLLDWATGSPRPRALVAAGLVGGLVGVALLLGPAALAGDGGNTANTTAARPGSVPPLAALVLFIAAISWSVGSLRARNAPRLPAAPLLLTGLQMLFGGAALGLLALAHGEPAAFDPARVSLPSVLAVVYLVVFGSLVGYTAFIWLLQRVSSARVSTYAYVNPVIAVFLGWAIGHEPLNARILLAAAIILGAVAIITWGSARVPVSKRA